MRGLAGKVNVRGYLAGCKYTIPHMLAAGSGSIIMTRPGSGRVGDLANIAYGSSKAAIIRLTRYVATICGKHRAGTPEDVAHARAYLAADEAKFLSGALGVLDGGVTRRNAFPFHRLIPEPDLASA
jgi:NAD(P)-dependent dehydrogenase (short-subunit alcohol dehydrogenase family)